MEDGYIITCIVILILLIFIITITFVVYINPDVNKVYFECVSGQCATNIYNGEKRCSNEDGTVIVYDPKYEVCNSKYTCENSLTPYALLKDGSTNEKGICEQNNVCRCLTKPQCSEDNVVLFSLKGGSTQIDNSQSRAYFDQLSKNYQSNISSIIYTNINTEFCAIKAYHLNIISPNACFFEDENNITLDEISYCLNLNPCINGLMAFYPLDINNFKLDNNAIYTYPVACVPSIRGDNNNVSLVNFCGVNKIPVFDKKTSNVICYEIIKN